MELGPESADLSGKLLDLIIELFDFLSLRIDLLLVCLDLRLVFGGEFKDLCVEFGSHGAKSPLLRLVELVNLVLVLADLVLK